MQKFVWAAAAVLAATVGTSAAIDSSEAARLTAAARVVQDIQATIPLDYWNRARCVIVIPDLKKAAFIIGGEYGKGVMSCRSGGSLERAGFHAARERELGLSGRRRVG